MNYYQQFQESALDALRAYPDVVVDAPEFEYADAFVRTIRLSKGEKPVVWYISAGGGELRRAAAEGEISVLAIEKVRDAVRSLYADAGLELPRAH